MIKRQNGTVEVNPHYIVPPLSLTNTTICIFKAIQELICFAIFPVHVSGQYSIIYRTKWVVSNCRYFFLKKNLNEITLSEMVLMRCHNMFSLRNKKNYL